MKIDFGILGVCETEDFGPFETKDGFTVVQDGYTEAGIRVHVVIDNDGRGMYPRVWNNAILIKLEDQ
ncbi:hypothetical protein D3C85_681710 [compost metagenome]